MPKAGASSRTPKAAGPPLDGPEENATGLPGLGTWRSVYLLVLGVFILYVVLMVVLDRIFA